MGLCIVPYGCDCLDVGSLLWVVVNWKPTTRSESPSKGTCMHVCVCVCVCVSVWLRLLGCGQLAVGCCDLEADYAL